MLSVIEWAAEQGGGCMSEDQGREQRLRLEALYRAMADDELVELASRPEDLTATASGVLAAEMQRRGLAAADISGDVAGDVNGAPIGLPEAGDLMPENLGALGPEMELITFYDALAVGRACEFLEEAGIPFHLTDVSGPKDGLRSFDGGPPVALRVTVAMNELQRAQSVLRKEMGLFPVENVESPDEPLDDGTRVSLGYFVSRGEAEEIAGVLTRAGIWNHVLEDMDEREHPFSVEVREMDLFAAGDVVEKALG